MKLYFGKNKKGVWKASEDESKLAKFSSVFESDVETVHGNRVYMIRTYYGFDYNFGSLTSSMYDVVNVCHQLFHSVHAAKKADVWKEREKLVKENPEKYHVTPFSIASDDGGSPFIFGDVMQGMFNMEIVPVRVI